MVGAIQPTIGTVRIDGARLTDWDQDELGQYIGYMPQEPSLFEGTIKENIARFDARRQRRRGEGDRRSVVAAAKEAGVHELILQLPQGYDTPLGLMGAGLSAGQAQRIALARALVRRAAPAGARRAQRLPRPGRRDCAGRCARQGPRRAARR